MQHAAKLRPGMLISTLLTAVLAGFERRVAEALDALDPLAALAERRSLL